MRIARILSIDAELSELESKIVQLRDERAALLTEELAASTGPNPSPVAETPAGTPAETPAKKQPARRRGRPPGKKNTPPAEGATPAAKPARTKAKKKKSRAKSRARLSPEKAKEMVESTVRAAGADGVSALQVSKSTGISYPIVAKLLKDNFRREGNRRDSRYYAD